MQDFKMKCECIDKKSKDIVTDALVDFIRIEGDMDRLRKLGVKQEIINEVQDKITRANRIMSEIALIDECD